MKISTVTVQVVPPTKAHPLTVTTWVLYAGGSTRAAD